MVASRLDSPASLGGGRAALSSHKETAFLFRSRGFCEDLVGLRARWGESVESGKQGSSVVPVSFPSILVAAASPALGLHGHSVPSPKARLVHPHWTFKAGAGEACHLYFPPKELVFLENRTSFSTWEESNGHHFYLQKSKRHIYGSALPAWSTGQLCNPHQDTQPGLNRSQMNCRIYVGPFNVQRITLSMCEAPDAF